MTRARHRKPGNRRSGTRAAAIAVLAAGAGLVGLPQVITNASTSSNPITAENAIPGDSYWKAYTKLATPDEVQGYISQVSVAVGDRLSFHVNSLDRYRIEIDRLGWYGGSGGRRVMCLPSCTTDRDPSPQPPPPSPDVYGVVDAAWAETDATLVPGSWTTGYYLARFVLTSGTQAGKLAYYPFIVRAPDSNTSAVLIEVPTNTWQAYNPWGGKSIYTTTVGGSPAVKVSFNRPLLPQYQQPVFGREYQAVRFLEAQGYDVSYVTDTDIDANPGLLLAHPVDLALGHGEYWSATMRSGWDAALAQGHNLVFLGGDIGSYLIRYEDNRRTLVAYKTIKDPGRPQTIFFRKQTPPWPECSLEGVDYNTGTHPGPGDYTVTDAAMTNPWLQAGGLHPGDKIVMAVGYEWDALDTAACPALPVSTLFHYQGTNGVSNADAATFTAPSGGRVFSAGSNFFTSMLDGFNHQNGQAADPRVQTFTRAMLDDLIASPATSTPSPTPPAPSGTPTPTPSAGPGDSVTPTPSAGSSDSLTSTPSAGPSDSVTPSLSPAPPCPTGTASATP